MTQETQILPATIQVNKDGLLVPRNIEEAFRLAKAYSISGVLPDRYANKPEMILTASQMALELGLKPLTGLTKIAVVKGTPTVFGDLPLAMVQSSGLCEYIKEGYINKDGKEISLKNGNLGDEAIGAYCIVKRKGDSEPRETSFTLAEARLADLMGNPTWKKYPKIMLKYRARAQALKDKFPDALNGIAIGEYDHNVMEAEVVEVPNQSMPAPSNSLEEKLKRKRQTQPETIDVEHSNDVDTIAETTENEVSND